MRAVTFVLLGIMSAVMPDAIGKTDDKTGQFNVIEVRAPLLLLYSSHDGEKVGERAQKEVPLPLPILDTKEMRFKVELLGKTVWIRQNQVGTDRPVKLMADCSPKGNAKGKVIMSTRGLGEECR